MHKKAPLPFTGQKRNFANLYISTLDQCIDNDGEGWIIVDAFGGSGLLSHLAKQTKPKANVIYNDYDNFTQRLKQIPDTNRLRKVLLEIVADVPRQQKIDSDLKLKIIETIKVFDGFIDWHSLNRWILFSGRPFVDDVERLYKETMYNTVRLNDYPVADDYLKGLTVTHTDYAMLLRKYNDDPKTLFILDPPYVCTQQGMYSNKSYFGMVEFLRLMQLVRPPFIFFSSTRSEFTDYVDFVIETNATGYNNLIDYKKLSIKTTMNKVAKYEDNLIYKF